jgi:UDP-glucose:(heptosyl)LPS alpha-1,3-glucosyltransferase
VHVFAQNYESVLPGVTYHRIPTPLARPRWINQLYFAWATWRSTRKGFDIVHSHENTWHGNVQTVHVLPIKHTLFAGRTGLAKVMRWLKVLSSPRLLAYLWLERLRYQPRVEKQVVLTSNTLREVMARTYPAAEKMMSVISPGVSKIWGCTSGAQSQAARQRLGLPLSGVLLLFVGNDFRKKGLPALLQAMTLIADEVQLVVVGMSAQLAEMRALALQGGVESRVIFLGSLVNLDDAYQAVNGLVHPTLEDTYAMVVLEAMSHGLPVVVSCSRYCGISAELEDGKEVLLLSDPALGGEIATKVALVLNDPTLAQSLSAFAIKFAKLHAWTTVARTYASLFSQIVIAHEESV